MKKKIIIFILILDLIILVLGGLNCSLLWNKAGLPAEYKAKVNSFSFDVNHLSNSHKIIEFDGKRIDKQGLVAFYLLNYKFGDEITIKSLKGGKTLEQKVKLEYESKKSDIYMLILVTLFYMFTGIYILLKFHNTEFALIVHMLTICTAVMVIYDWGNLFTLSKTLNFIIMSIFEICIFMVPTLFLNFSFNYPLSKSRFKLVVLIPFYFTSILCSLISIINLAKVIFFGFDVNSTYFLQFHNQISDIFLIIGIILTVAKLEHSALIIQNPIARKQVYWALLGFSFGPLVYVFLRLIPRLVMGFELVSLALMDFTILIAPIMLLISVSSKK